MRKKKYDRNAILNKITMFESINYRNVRLHRNTQTFHKNSEGKLHNLDGPALITSNFSLWCVNGLKHRDDGPAYICNDGTQMWFNHGKLHRGDGGPAAIFPNGKVEYFINGKEFDKTAIIKKLGLDPDYITWDETDRVAYRLALP